MVERARQIGHELVAGHPEAMRSHFGETVYVPTDEEGRMLDEALRELQEQPTDGRSWEDVRSELWPRG